MSAEVNGWGRKPQAELAALMARVAGGVGTSAGGNFFTAQMELFGFVNFVSALPRHIDGVLEGFDSKSEDERKASKVFQRGLDPFRPLIGEVVVTRAVDSYLTYISELLSLVFRKRPETLRSKEQISIDFVLGFDSLEELQDAIAERRVERLSYRGMAELADWVRDTLGFTLISDRERLRLIERLVEQRNLIVHHRGIIDHRFIRKCGTAFGNVGDALDLREASAEGFMVLSEAVWDADGRAAEKWDLERHSLPTSGVRG